MKNTLNFTKFDFDDEETYPKCEGSYLIIDGLGKFHVAFWTEVQEMNRDSEISIARNPHWISEFAYREVVQYSTTTLANLDWKK